MAIATDRSIDELDFEPHRRELTGYCYRMLGSGFEAEDAVQETMVRAWKKADTYEGRATVRSWLYRIAHNVCLDMLRAPQRRALPMEMGPAQSADGHVAPPIEETTFVSPMADIRILPVDTDAAEVAEARESVRLAFVAALQHLPPKQRAALILCEVLKWQATEAAELLETSVASVNSALQRARATLDQLEADGLRINPEIDDDTATFLAAYIEAFERYDVEAIVALVADDVEFCMPPYPMWLSGPTDVGKWLAGPGIGCEGSRLLVTTGANGCPALGSYRKAEGGGHEPFALQVLQVTGGKITAWHNFLDPKLFPEFGLPTFLPPQD